MTYGETLIFITSDNVAAYRTMSSYSLSLPFESRHFRNETDASTFAGEYVFGSFNSEIILSRIVLKHEFTSDNQWHYRECKNIHPKFLSYMINTYINKT